MHEMNSKGIVKFNFVILCLAFRGSILTVVIIKIDRKETKRKDSHDDLNQ